MGDFDRADRQEMRLAIRSVRPVCPCFEDTPLATHSMTQHGFQHIRTRCGQAMSDQASMPSVVSTSSQTEAPSQPVSKLHRWLGAVDIFGVLSSNKPHTTNLVTCDCQQIHASRAHQWGDVT